MFTFFLQRCFLFSQNLVLLTTFQVLLGRRNRFEPRAQQEQQQERLATAKHRLRQCRAHRARRRNLLERAKLKRIQIVRYHQSKLTFQA